MDGCIKFKSEEDSMAKEISRKIDEQLKRDRKVMLSNSSLKQRQGIDFVFSLSQEQEQEKQIQASPKSIRIDCTTGLELGP